MQVWNVRNVNAALWKLRYSLEDEPRQWRAVSPRKQATLEYVTPLTTVYTFPWERVLFNAARDANPFFHLMDALWLLAGHADVAPLAKFNKGIVEFSDNGQTFFGAYGWRLRRCGIDQLQAVVRLLKADPDSRQAVLAIWDRYDLGTKTKDLPCNTHVYLKVRDGKLNITVCCRSNDALWGAYGTNAVQFSILQEYLAACIGVEIGEYRQVSDSFHVYTESAVYKRIMDVALPAAQPDYYPLHHLPLVQDPGRFFFDVHRLFDCMEQWPDIKSNVPWEPFFVKVVFPVLRAWFDRPNALSHCAEIAAADWRRACTDWINRRTA